MKYFIHTEFIEGFREQCIRFPFKWKQCHFIDLISIGIFCEDGRSLYAISNEWNFKQASEWLKENVIKKLPGEELILYQTNEEIKEELLGFFGCWRERNIYRAPEGIEVYGYFADYDWVVLCSLFGRMIDLPKGFPMYCRDLKQMMDERGLTKEWKKNACPDPSNAHDALADAKWNFDLYHAILQAK